MNSAHLAQLPRLRSTLPISPRSFQESVQQLPPEQAWAVEYLVDSGNIEVIAIGLAAGTVIAVADESFKNQLGTSAFTLIDENTGHRLEGANLVPGQPSDQSAYRSELAGLFGIMIVCKIICQVFKLAKDLLRLHVMGWWQASML
jgi:hypothetical protein